jgi:hypothetical protein
MITVENEQLLGSQDSLQALSETSLPGRHALQLMGILEEVQTHLEHVHEVRTQLANRDEEEEAAEQEWQDVLDDELEINENPIPRSAIAEVEGIEAKDLYRLRWLLSEEDEENEE